MTIYNAIQIINHVFVTIPAPHNLILFFCHCFIIKVYFTQRQRGNTLWLSLFPIIMQFILAFWVLINDWNLYIFSCEWGVKVGLIFFTFSKVSIYVFFAERLFRVFNNSQSEFKRRTIITTRIAFVKWSIWAFINT
eukprot:UN07064